MTGIFAFGFITFDGIVRTPERRRSEGVLANIILRDEDFFATSLGIFREFFRVRVIGLFMNILRRVVVEYVLKIKRYSIFWECNKSSMFYYVHYSSRLILRTLMFFRHYGVLILSFVGEEFSQLLSFDGKSSPDNPDGVLGRHPDTPASQANPRTPTLVPRFCVA
jgi:hypothetical protein